MIGEERRTRERSAGPGWVATAGGALFLVALGFSVGLVAGTAYQEPQLVADHLAGRTTEVATEVVLDAEEPLAATPDVAAPAPDEAPAAPLGEGALAAEPGEHARASASERARGLVPRSEPKASEGEARASASERARGLVPRSEPKASEGEVGEAEATAPAVEAAAAPRQEAKVGAGESFAIQVGAFGSEKAARQLAGELGQRGYTTFLMDEGEGARFKVRVGPIGSRAEAERISERLKREQRLPTWILAAGAAQQQTQ